MIVLDTSVLVAYLDSADVHHAAAVEVLSQLAPHPWGASQVTLAEVLVGPARAGEAQVVTAQRILDDLGVAELPLPGEHGALALARLKADTGLKLPDCCVLLAARERGASLASFDRRLCRAARDYSLAVHGDS